MTGVGGTRYRSSYLRVAAGIVGMVALLVASQVAWVEQAELRHIEQVALERSAHDMALLQTTLAFALASGVVEQVDREMTARGADPDLVALVLVDEEGNVIGSSRREQIGRPVEAALAEALPADMIAAARDHRVGSTRLSPDGQAVVATYPVVLGVEPGRVRAGRIGVLVSVYSLERAQSQVYAHLAHHALELALGGGIGAALLILAGQVYFGKRVQALVTATRRFSGGDLEARAAVSGTDELALIGEAFDAMAARVGETQRAIAESEARFRALVESAPVGILRMDSTGRVVACNPAWRELAGGDCEAWPAALHPDDRARVLELWTAARAEGRPARAECRLVRPDARIVWIQALGVPEKGPHPSGFITTAVDLTERRRAEQARADLEARLQQAQKLEALGTLASGVAHDFNNVLAAVIGHAGLLERRVLGEPELERHVAQVLNAAERGRALVQQVLTVGRPGPRSPREVRLAPLLDEVARFLGPALPGNVQLRVSVGPDLPPVLGEPDQLHRVLMNLGTNASQAMRPAGGILEMEARAIEVDDALALQLPGVRRGPAVRIDVRDQGVGMDEATRARIFEPFFTTKAPGEGTGLGLAVVHGVVRAHGGGVLVQSAPGRGTTVSVILPAARAEEPRLAPPGEAPAPTPSPPAPPRPERVAPPPRLPAAPSRILYVDDDEALLELARLAFGRAGHAVTTCASPTAALATFRAAPRTFDLVVTDQRMPEMLGEELLVALRETRPDIPVVVMSGCVTPDVVGRLRARGAWAVVEKPMTIDALVGLCQGVLVEARRS